MQHLRHGESGLQAKRRCAGLAVDVVVLVDPAHQTLVENHLSKTAEMINQRAGSNVRSAVFSGFCFIGASYLCCGA